MARSVDGVTNCDALKIWLFINTLKGAAFVWHVQLPTNSITVWVNLKEKFILHFQEENQPITMAHLCNTKQNENKSSLDFVKRWRELSFKDPDLLSHKAIVGICKNNLKTEVRSLIVGVRTKTMVQLIEAAAEAKGILIELKKNSPKAKPSSPAITFVTT